MVTGKLRQKIKINIKEKQEKNSMRKGKRKHKEALQDLQIT